MSTALFTTMEWQDNALCRGRRDINFFPTPGDKGSVDAAKALCKECPAKDPCFNHALYNEPYGFWAGMTEERRFRLRKKRGIPNPMRPDHDNIKRRSHQKTGDDVEIEHDTRRGYQSHVKYDIPFTKESGEACGCQTANAEYSRQLRAKRANR